MEDSFKFIILIVDDMPQLRLALSFLLEKEGYQVLQASGGNHALAVLQTNPVDLIVSDVDMPEGNGFDLLHRIKSLHIEVPLIFLTGNSEITESMILEIGGAGLVDKTKMHISLLNKIKAILSQKE